MSIQLKVIGGPHQGKEYLFREHDSFIVGRGKQAHFRLARDDQYFSRIHFMVEINPPQCRLVDLGSRNGTKVNNRRVESADLQHGDIIAAGQTLIQVVIDTETASSSVIDDANLFPTTVAQTEETNTSPSSRGGG